MIVGSTVDDIEIPHEPGNKIGIRQLSGLEMDEAADLKSIKSTRRWGSIGKEALDALRSDTVTQQAVTDAGTGTGTEEDPVDNYDREFLITHAIVRWSGAYYSNLECTDENKRLLDEPTLKWIVKEIVTRNYVPLVKLSTLEESTHVDS